MKPPAPAFLARVSCLVLAALIPGAAQDLAPVPLPKPQTTGGKPLMEALAARSTGREFGPEKLSPQVLSNLLWAAYGVNRPDGKRTAPSAMNRQTIDIYVALPAGIYLFEPGPHKLTPVAPGDHRPLTGSQPFVAEAALNVVFVSDDSKMAKSKPEDRMAMTAAETGFIGQNIYLFCASEGLATVFRASLDREGFAKAAKLRPDQRPVYAQSVGYPKKK